MTSIGSAPFILELNTPEATLERVGGKGAAEQINNGGDVSPRRGLNLIVTSDMDLIVE